MKKIMNRVECVSSPQTPQIKKQQQQQLIVLSDSVVF